MCGDEIETDYHVPVSCALAMPVWNDIYGEGWPRNISTITDWWSWVLAKDNDMVQKSACLLWALCARRNHYVWNNKMRTSSQVARHGLGFLAEWCSVNAKPNLVVSVTFVQSWRRPQQVGSNATLMLAYLIQEMR